MQEIEQSTIRQEIRASTSILHAKIISKITPLQIYEISTKNYELFVSVTLVIAASTDSNAMETTRIHFKR